MKKHIFILIFILTLLWNNVNAHTIPASSIPRLSYDAILALPSPHKGDLAYDLTYDVMRLYNNAGWVAMATLPPPPCDGFTALSGGGEYDNEITYDAATDNAGNVFVIGAFFGTVTFGEFTLTSEGDYEVFIAKYNVSGELEWAKRAGGPHNDFGTSLTVDNVGNIYITGYFYTMMNFNNPSDWGSNVIYSAGETDAFVAKYNSSGDVQWIRRAGGTNNDNASSITVDNNGNVFIMGSFWETANFNTPLEYGSNDLVSAGSQDIFIAKYNATGDLQWLKRAGGIGSDATSCIKVDSGGNVYMTGGFNETINFNTPSTSGSNELVSDGNYDIFIVKLDNDGTIQWLKRAGGTSLDIGASIAIDNSGNIYVTGTFSETINFNNPSASGSNELESAGGYDIFIAKYNSSGNALWVKRVGGIENEYGTDITIDILGNPYILGNFVGTINFNTPSASGSNELVSAGGQDIFIAKYNPSGEVLWLKEAGGEGVDQATAMAIGATGTIHATGYFGGTTQFGSSSLTSTGGLDFFLTYITSSPPAPTGTSNATICNNTTASLSATCAIGTVNWYDTNGTALLFTGSPFVTPALTANISYKVGCESGGSPSCTSAFVDVTVTVNPAVATPTGTSDPTICFNTTTSLSATCATGTVNWYDTNGTALQGTGSPFITPSLFANTTYKVRCKSGGSPNCSSNFVDVTVTVNPAVAAPTGTSDPTICNNTTASLSATCAAGTVNWYDTNGTALQSTGSPFVTPSLSANTTYKVRCESGGSPSCTSAFVDVTVTVNPAVAAPTGTSDPIICFNTTASLSATCATGTVNWYDANGTASQGTGSPFVTPALTANISYKVGCESGGSPSCTSAFVDVTVTVNPAVAAPTGTSDPIICFNTTASLSATCATGTVNWYDTNGTALQITGSPFITPSLGSNTTYKVRCESGGSPSCTSAFVDVTVTVNPAVAAPTGTANPTICNNTTASLPATCAAGTVNWYDTNGTALQSTGSPFVTPSLSANTTYKVRCESGGSPNCSSAFVDVTVTVNPAVAAPTGTSDPTICFNTTASLSATCAIGTVNWYDTNGTALQGTGSPFITPSLSANTTYKVRCESGGSPNCSGAFVDVTVTVNPAVAASTGTANPTICFNTITSLSASCVTGTVKWYDTNGTALQSTGSPFVTPSLSSNTTYKVRCESGDCGSSFTTVLVTVNPNLTNPTAVLTSSSGICLGSNITLSATCQNGTITWHNQQTGGAVLGTGNGFSQSPTSNTTYYVSCELGNCTSNRVATAIVLVGTPASNLIIAGDISSGNTVQIANQNITATNKVISPARVVYRAGNSIMLNAGFEARSGSIFKAEIGGCSN